MPGWVVFAIGVAAVLAIVYLVTLLFNVDFQGSDGGGKNYVETAAVSTLLR